MRPRIARLGAPRGRGLPGAMVRYMRRGKSDSYRNHYRGSSRWLPIVGLLVVGIICISLAVWALSVSSAVGSGMPTVDRNFFKDLFQ
jgi:hypothetical protein